MVELELKNRYGCDDDRTHDFKIRTFFYYDGWSFGRIFLSWGIPNL